MLTDKRIADLEHKVAILTRLSEINTVLSSTLKLKPLLNSIMEAAVEIVDSEAASVLLWDHKTNDLRFAATTTGAGGQALIGKPVPLEGSIAGTVLRENRPVSVDDVLKDSRHYGGIDRATDFMTRSVLGVPMRSRNRVIGVLEAVNKRADHWTQDDLNYLTIVASQAAVAIESAQLVAALQKANEELNQLDKLKSDFIAIASHELRTPLGVILGYTSFLQETQDEEVRDLASKVVASALQLRRIIEDLTNLRYMEQNEGDLNREAVPLGEFLNDIVHDMLPLVEAKHHRLQYAPPPPEVKVSIDRIRMGMALTNVLNNALRFTPENGRIVVQTDLRGDHEVWVTVTDTGIGLARDQTERIFERFYQVEDHMTRKNGGMGIGLSIARAMVEAHGGRIWATSNGLNQGSTFTITMPLAE
ncbi:MAG TPA: GAF domain-containing sensor histidine kinase [Phototrophicaceae bacterium]|nr:GAF domain-containing sensor histidine kinase [Phototrophicaceae bacterium]